MAIRIPQNIKSPTILIIGGSEPSAKKNENYSKRLDTLERKIDQNYQRFIKKQKNEKIDLKPLLSRFDALEKAIQKTLIKKKKINNSRMDKSFENMLLKLQKTIEKTKPRMYPSPS